MQADLPHLTHLNSRGRARMIDVSTKPVQRRIAQAAGSIALAPRTLVLIRRNRLQKGDVLSVARLAGIQAAKQAAGLIPLCHPISLDHVNIEMTLRKSGVSAMAEVTSTGRTGAEMEALTAVSVALLTVYDMCKAVDRQMRIGGIRLIQKRKFNA